MARNKFTFSLTAEAVNKDLGILSGVSMITVGPVRGHGTYADLKTLDTVRECAETHKTGLQVKMDHSGGARDIVGVLKAYRVEGNHLRANLHLLKNSSHYGHLLEMCELMPGSFGLSVAFSGDHEVVEIADGIQVEAMRCREIYSCDVVDSPAANPLGLFSMTTKPKGADPAGAPTDPAGGPKDAPANQPPASALSVPPDQLTRWADIQTGLELLIVNVTHAVEALAEMQKQLPTLFEGLAVKFADAELLALKRLGALGVPAGTVPATNGQTGLTGSPGYPGPKSLHEQLEAIPATEGARRRAFMKEHRAELYAELNRKG